MVKPKLTWNAQHEDLALAALERIEELQHAYECVQNARTVLARRPYGSYLTGSGQDLLAELVQVELDEWRNLFMWALVLDEKHRDRIKQAARARFLAEGSSASQWMNRGIGASMWAQADEDEFRAMVNKLFGGKGDGKQEA